MEDIKYLELKLKQCFRLMDLILKRNNDINNIPPRRYYNILKRSQDIRVLLNSLYCTDLQTSVLEKTRCYFDSQELSINSTTYLRIKNRINKDIDLRFKNRR